MSETPTALVDRVSEQDRLFDYVTDALIVLSNVAEGDFDLQVAVPEELSTHMRAIFEGINDMIRSLGHETRRSNEYRDELESKVATIEAQRSAISELSTPVMEVWKGILCFPVVGLMDTSRSAEMTKVLLDSVARKETRCCIIDLTGIEVMDTATADHFLRMARAVALLGSECVLTGISPPMAQTIVHMGVDLSSIRLHRTLQDALEERLRSKRRLPAPPPAGATGAASVPRERASTRRAPGSNPR